MNGQTKENTLYLPIKQVYFDQIVNGTKKAEYREVKYGITASRYLLHDESGKEVLNPDCTDKNKIYYLDDYNNGHFPFLPKPIKYLNLAVGYAKDRDTCTVEVTDISFEAHNILGQGENKYAFWVIVFHLGNAFDIYRKNRF